jgi:sigma-B regulation protein RsbU (phosphoserine phosphatase)
LGSSEPAKSVGGDYFNYIQSMSDGDNLVWNIIVADVSGKGIPASLIVSNLDAALQLLIPRYKKLDELCFHLNNFLKKNLILGTFVTMFITRLNWKTNTLHYANCGHNPSYYMPFSSKQKKAIPLPMSGPILALKENTEYTTRSLPFHPGDMLIMYSDGIVEAQNNNHDLFSERKMIKEAFRFYKSKSMKLKTPEIASKVKDQILNEVEIFRDDAPVNDDATLIILHRWE